MRLRLARWAVLFAVLAAPDADAVPKGKAAPPPTKKQVLTCTLHSLITRGKMMNVKFEIDEANQQVDGQPATITDDLITQTTPPDTVVAINRYTGQAEAQSGGYRVYEGTCEVAKQRF